MLPSSVKKLQEEEMVDLVERNTSSQKVFEDFSSFHLGKRVRVRLNTAELKGKLHSKIISSDMKDFFP